jgi:hypothetical protein
MHPLNIAPLWTLNEHLTIARRSDKPKAGQIILVGDLDGTDRVIDGFKIKKVLHEGSICIVMMPDGSEQYRWTTYITARGRVCGG